MKLKGNEGLLAPILQRVYHCHTILKKIVNKEVLCNLQLSHKHSGHDFAKNGEKMWIRLYSGKALDN